MSRQAHGVAILTDPGGSVLRTNDSSSSSTKSPRLRPSPTPEGRCCCWCWSARSSTTGRCCDPHRPRRVGAARAPYPRAGRRPRRLRSSPTPEGRCCAFHRRPLLPHADHVAILTDPGGSVLLLEDRGRRRADDQLRSSPTPEGRCCPSSTSATRCRPVTCCDPHRPRRVGAAVPQQGDCADHGHPTL